MPGDSTKIIENADLGLFGLLMSRMHMTWLKGIGGRLDNRLRYSKSVVYNTFPAPSVDLDVLEPYAQKILNAREKYAESTLADLYDKLAMPNDLRKAHKTLDKAVDRLYRPEPFENDYDRLEFLLERYTKMISN